MNIRLLLNLFVYVWRHPLNAEDRLSALLRVLRWQLASRLMKGPIAMPFAEDMYLFATRGMTGATGNWYCGLHEVREMALVLHLLRPDDHFVDVGANIGSYTILAAGGVKARVTAVEPIPETFEHLECNVMLNRLTERVRCCRMGLSDLTGILRFSAKLDTVNHVLAEDEDLPGIDVPVTTLDELVSGDPPVVMKIDVEGHERAVLLGGKRTLGDQDLLAVIMETNGSGGRYGVLDEELLVIMSEHGFKPFGYDPFARELVDMCQSEGNTVFIRDTTEVEMRVRSARKFQLINGEI